MIGGRRRKTGTVNASASTPASSPHYVSKSTTNSSFHTNSSVTSALTQVVNNTSCRSNQTIDNNVPPLTNTSSTSSKMNNGSYHTMAPCSSLTSNNIGK